MGALKIHHTPTVDQPWDGPANKARLKNDGTQAYYRSAYAWQDTAADPKTKAAYKFIHHDVGEDGSVGAANVRAAIATIAILNGGRGGSNIPDSDRQGVWAHVAAHLKDADMVPAELKGSDMGDIERRFITVQEFRAAKEEGKPTKLVGYAARFNSLSEDLGGFREKIAPGAFKKTIKSADVRALWNHNADYVLGRTKSKTLTLQEDEEGLMMEVEPPDTQWARDLMVSIERGDVTQMSFGFRTISDKWEHTEGEPDLRTLEEVELFDVSPVTYPAYPETNVAVRSRQEWLKSQPGESDDSAEDDGGAQPMQHADIMRKKLDLLEKL